MTFANQRDSHQAKTRTWNEPFGYDFSRVTALYPGTPAPESISSSHRSENGNSCGQNPKSSQSSSKDSAGSLHHHYLFDYSSPPNKIIALSASDASSTTSNARASRMFRERRKEREKILRETVAELVERNAALEALLLSHGLVPPPAVTLRHDLALHRSQKLGGPPIHIPGVTPTKPPVIPSHLEPNHLHDGSSGGGPKSEHLHQEFSPMSAHAVNAHFGLSSASYPFSESGASSVRHLHPVNELLDMQSPSSPIFDPAQLCNARQARRVVGGFPFKPKSGQSHVKQGMSRRTSTAAERQVSGLIDSPGECFNTTLSLAQEQAQQSQLHSVSSTTQTAIASGSTHSRTGSEPVSQAKAPALTPAEHSVIASKRRALFNVPA